MMTLRSPLTPLALLGALALGACTDAPVAPTPDASAARAAAAGGAAARHLVTFRSSGGVPSGFAEEVGRLGGTVEGTMPEVGAAVVAGLSGQGLAALARVGGVQDVIADEAIPMETRRLALDDAATTLALDVASPVRPDLAGLFPLQWNMQAIDAPTAWQAGRLGSSSVTVAILDTGIDEATPSGARSNIDLQGRVDRQRSRSFMPVEDTVVQRLFPGVATYTDLDGHGTNVASQVASNGFNFAGVSSQTRLMAVKVCTILPPAPTAANPNPQPGYCSTASVFAGLYYAVDNGADVINMSLGGGFPKSQAPGAASAFARLMNYAKSRGVTVVVAAGNSAHDLDHDGDWYNTYCSAPNAICVAATGPTSAGPLDAGPFLPSVDAPAIYSEYGRSAINVAAPGGNYAVGSVGGQPAIVSAAYVWSLCPRLTAAAYNPATKRAQALGPCGVWGFIGTSQASPHVAGLAAMLVPTLGRNPGAIRAAIQGSADDLGAPGTDPHYGKGRINVARALGVE